MKRVPIRWAITEKNRKSPPPFLEMAVRDLREGRGCLRPKHKPDAGGYRVIVISSLGNQFFQQHGYHLAEIFVEFVHCPALRVGTGKAGYVSDEQSGRGIPLDHRCE